ncbi:MAG: hypothetical protein PHY48_03445 [Candidatus Cloacimonetes bacterium]|nr:hypothetical protein [Candidatus Cloacimonadota bacterium]
MQYPQLVSCHICPRNCGINRYAETGFCGAGSGLKINLASLHHGEEPPISGSKGSGTIFFSHCNLRCVFCQNYSISSDGWGYESSALELAKMMLRLQEQQAHNINLVTPTHYSPQVIDAIKIAKDIGLTIPIVWNSSAYESLDTLESLAGLVDIYLPDLKYAYGVHAAKYSAAADYPRIALAAIKAMYAQSGNLQLDDSGIAKRGTIVRLLVMPNGLSGAQKSLLRLADEIGTEISISLMGQYYPAGKASEYNELNRGITMQEYQSVVDTAQELGFSNIFIQELSCSDIWTPKFGCDEDSVGWQTNGVANSVLPQHPQDASMTAPPSLPIRRLAAQEMAATGVANSVLPQHPQDASMTAPPSLPIRRLAAHEMAAHEMAAHEMAANGVANSVLPQHPQDASMTASPSLPIRRLAAHEMAAQEMAAHEMAAHDMATL